jgi:hypothetical protein
LTGPVQKKDRIRNAMRVGCGLRQSLELAPEIASAAASAAVTAVAAIATSATEAATAATTKATRAGLFGARFVDNDGPAVNGLPVQRCNGCLSFLRGAHFDKPETFGPAGHTVHDYFSAHDFAVSGEHFLKCFVGCVVTQIADVQLRAHPVISLP